MLKKLLNRAEENTFRILQGVCSGDNACVHVKVGLREIFNARDSALTAALRNYCFMAHFDFLITDGQFNPLFAVEFDGPTHQAQEQKQRDAKKNELCKIFNLPLLRINSKYLSPLYRGTDLLAWFTECFFVKRAFEEAYEKGIISPEEGFTPQFISSIGDRDWPLWLSHDIREQLRRIQKTGKCCDWMPSYLVGRDQEQTCRAIAVIAVTKETAVFATTAMKAQQFPIGEEDAVEELVCLEVFEALQTVLSGHEKPTPLSEIHARIHEFDKKVRLSGLSAIGGRIPPLKNNPRMTTMF